MNISERGIALIKQFEGFRSRPYLDAVGIATIGYGFTYYQNGTKVTMSDPPITKEQADHWLKAILKDYQQVVNREVKPTINQAQFDALVCFAYNVGIENFKKSTLLKKINHNPQDKTITDEFKRWKYANGKPLRGLIKRRAKEAALYFSYTLILLFFSACRCPKAVVLSDSTQEKTAVFNRTLMRDTLVLTQPKAVELTLPISVLEKSNGQAIEKTNDNAKVRVIYRDRKVYVKALCDTDRIRAKIPHYFTDSIRTVTRRVLQVQKVKYTPKVLKILSGIGGLFLLLIGLGVILKIRKII